MGFRVTGIDKLQRKLADLSRRAKDLHGQHNVPVTELLTPSFLGKCSRFNSVVEFFNSSGFRIESAEDFAAIPDAAWESFVKMNTTYGNWREMLSAATGEWAKKRLTL